MRAFYVALQVFVLVSAYVGCTGPILTSTSSVFSTEGIPYSLPKTVVEATITIALAPDGGGSGKSASGKNKTDEPQKSPARPPATTAAASGALPAPAVTNPNASVSTMGGGDDEEEEASLDDGNDAEQKTPNKELEVEEESLEEGTNKPLEEMLGNGTESPKLPDVSVTLRLKTITVADPEERYVVKYNTDPHQSDDLDVAMSSIGLLKTVKAHSKDELLNALLEGAQEAAKATALFLANQAGGGAVTAMTGDRAKKIRDAKRRLMSVLGTHVVHWDLPRDPKHLVGKAYRPFPADPSWVLHLSAVPVARCKAPVGGCACVPSGRRGRNVRAGGVYVKATDPYVLHARFAWKPYDDLKGAALMPTIDEIQDAPEKFNQTSTEALVHLPDYSPRFMIPLDRVRFVETKHDLTFDANGRLTRVTATRPSEFKAVAKKPFEIAKEIVSIPAQILQFRINYTTGEAKLKEQQDKLDDTAKNQEKQATAANDLGAAKTARAAFDNATTPNERHTKWVAFVNAATKANTSATLAGLPQPYSDDDLVEPDRDSQVALEQAAEAARRDAINARAIYDSLSGLRGPNASEQRRQAWANFVTYANAANRAALLAQRNTPFAANALIEPGRAEADKLRLDAENATAEAHGKKDLWTLSKGEVARAKRAVDEARAAVIAAPDEAAKKVAEAGLKSAESLLATKQSKASSDWIAYVTAARKANAAAKMAQMAAPFGAGFDAGPAYD